MHAFTSLINALFPRAIVSTTLGRHEMSTTRASPSVMIFNLKKIYSNNHVSNVFFLQLHTYPSSYDKFVKCCRVLKVFPEKGPPMISKTTQRSDKQQTVLDSPWRELSEAYIFFLIEVMGQVKLRSNAEYYVF